MASGNLLFFYFGDDEAYFKTLQGEFRRHTRLSIEFKRFYESDESRIQTLYLKVYNEMPAAVFIDFSKNPQDYLHLARLLSRTPLDHKMATVGLVDYLSPPEVLLESIATGVNLTHIKSSESYDVVFDVAKLIAPQEMGEHGFATAQLKEDWEAGIVAKIGYVHPEGLHLETDYHSSKGDRLRLKHHWIDNKIVPSQQVFVKDTSEQNLFYHFKGSVDVDFLFIDEFIPPEGMEEDRIKEKRDERNDLIKVHKKHLEKWIDDNLSRSLEKKSKVLVVDRELKFYDHQTRSDKHPYLIRSVPYLDDISEELERLQPKVIAFSLESKTVEAAKNNSNSLVKLAEVIKAKYKELNPLIVVFNSELNSKDMQEGLGFEHVMATSNEITVELLIKMLDLFDKKLQKELGTSSNDDRVFLKKSNTDSIAEIIISVKVIKLSETDMYFQSEIPLPPGVNFHMSKPVDMFVSVQPSKGQGAKEGDYYGLIHSLGEAQKKELRKYVNSVFFREHDAGVQAESAEFKKLNDTKLQEKLNLIQKTQDDLAAKEKEAVEKSDADAKEAARPHVEEESSS